MAIMQHFFLQTCFNARMVLNVAIVEMVAPESIYVNGSQACPNLPDLEPASDLQEISYPWPRHVRSFILSAFYIGYSVSQIPGGWLADKFGARWVQGTTLIVTILITAVFPVCIQYFGYIAAIVLRCILGFAQGPCIPTVSSLISSWIPPNERSIWGGIAFSGSNLGVVMASVFTGMIVKAYHWKMAFYVWAAYCAAYFAVFLCFVFSFPHTHPNIRASELNHIKRSHSDHSNSLSGRSLSTPWRKILTNGPYLANVSANFAHSYIYFSFGTYIPTYLTEILKYDVNSTGLYSALPFMVLWISSLAYSFTAAYLHKCITPNAFNIIFGAGGNLASAALILTAKYMGCNRTLAMALLCLSMVPKAFYYVTILPNFSALSLKYGGILCGISNAVGSCSGIIGNHIIGAITKQGSMHGWITAYWICVGISIFSTIIFWLFTSNSRQDPDRIVEENDQ